MLYQIRRVRASDIVALIAEPRSGIIAINLWINRCESRCPVRRLVLELTSQQMVDILLGHEGILAFEKRLGITRACTRDGLEEAAERATCGTLAET